MSRALTDSLDRPIRDLRISVTDRCNLRCTYCMPLDEYVWIEREQILTYEEITRLASIFAGLGVDKIRLTGGEPLVRKGVEELVARLSALGELKDLCLTTNGLLLAEKAQGLRAAGLTRVNVSLDTLKPDRFRRIAQRGDLSRVLDGLFAAKQCGLNPIKINAVIERGVNDDEILNLVEFSSKNGFAIRFIEYMDVGNVNGWKSEKVVPKSEIVAAIDNHFRLKEIGRNGGSAPSVDYRSEDGSVDMGVIASVTEPFCSDCTRVRLTADGKMVTCLFSESGHDLKALLRNGATDREIRELIRAVWTERRDRYSEERFEALKSVRGYQPKEHKKLEMISLGG